MTDIKFENRAFSGKIMWARIFTPEEGFKPQNPKSYSVHLVVTPELETAIKSMLDDLKIGYDDNNKFDKHFKTQKTGERTFKFAINEFNSKGQPNKVLVTEADGKTVIDPSVLVGNGTTATIHVRTFTSGEGKTFRSGVQLVGVQVLDLVEYQAPVADLASLSSGVMEF